MRNKYLLGLGGALLASTSLSAASMAANVTNKGVNATTAFVNVKISAQLFGSGGVVAASTIGPQSLELMFSNAYNLALQPKIVVTATGAAFSGSSLGGQLNSYLRVLGGSTAGTVIATGTGSSAGCNVGVLGSQIQITNCALNLAGGTAFSGNTATLLVGLDLSGIIYTAATSLATAGASITIGGSLSEQANPTNTFETITPTAVITSANAATAQISTASGSANVSSSLFTTAFATVTQTLAGNANTGNLTFILAQISYTGVGVVGASLQAITIGSLVGNLALTVTSPVLSDPAISNVRFMSNLTTSVATSTTLAGTATFAATSITGAVLYGAANTTTFIQVEYNGTTGITGGAATTAGLTGTYTAATGSTQTNATGLPALSGATGGVSRASFTVQVNSVQPSSNTTVQSYIRVTNGGSAAGAAIFTLYNAATGAVLGTYTSAAVPGLSTLQISAKDLETGAAIAPLVGGAYTVVVSGAIPSGYVQHITGNAGNLFVDFSGRRNSTTGQANTL